MLAQSLSSDVAVDLEGFVSALAGQLSTTVVPLLGVFFAFGVVLIGIRWMRYLDGSGHVPVENQKGRFQSSRANNRRHYRDNGDGGCGCRGNWKCKFHYYKLRERGGGGGGGRSGSRNGGGGNGRRGNGNRSRAGQWRKTSRRWK